jgi:predicted molibdopterin-dependent oxidoreductase YjgC
MVRLKIDNIEVEVPDGITLLEAARYSGMRIPVLCDKDGLPHYSSCMVCMVRDNKSKVYIPSCTALVQPEMDIDISGEAVVSLRKKAIELLLSEHRAECEAPCRTVCPAGYNIPVMNRYLIEGNIKAAIELSISEMITGEIHCIQCPGYCENACRRKKIDLPVSIRNIQLFISQNISTEDKSRRIAENLIAKKPGNDISASNSLLKAKRFISHTGKIEAAELNEWLKECINSEMRFRDITEIRSAVKEANSCMHCDCRAAEDCRLRDIAEEFAMKDPRGKLVNAPAVKKINLHTNLIFENAKCIKCGLCVRICEDKSDDPPLCYLNRGFVSIISEPLTSEFTDTMRSTARQCIEVCPTGALAYFK